MKRLENKVAIVTGAAGGMGEAIALLFAREGACVLATDIQEEKLKHWVAEAKQEDLQIACMIHDVASRTDWEKVVNYATTTFGRLNVLINNAGIYPAGSTLENTDQELWDKVIAINLTGAFIGSQVALPHMQKNGGGAIVNISSIAGMVGGNGPAYSASKGGLRLLTKDHAVELAKYNIRVNSIHPGGVLTPMTEGIAASPESEEIIKHLCPLGRMGNVMEIAYGALYLASDEASYVTGVELAIDGGLTAR